MSDDYPVCDVLDCEGYGTAHGPLLEHRPGHAITVPSTADTVIRIIGFLALVVGGLLGAGLPVWAILVIAGFTAMMVAS